MKIKMLKQSEIESALKRTEDELRQCSEKANRAYVHNLLGKALALRFVLGWSQGENHRRNYELSDHILVQERMALTVGHKIEKHREFFHD